MSEENKKEEEIVIEHVLTPDEEAANKKKSEEKVSEIKKIETTPTEGDDLKKMLSEVEERERIEREKRISAEKERDEERSKATQTTNQLAKSEDEKIKIQAIAIDGRLASAKSEVERIEGELENAMDAGKSNKDIIALNKKLADAVWEARNVEAVKRQFDNQVQQLKTRPNNQQIQQTNSDVTPAAQKWIDANPRFNTDPKFYRAAVGAHHEALKNGLAPDSKAYFDHIDSVIKEEGLAEDTKISENQQRPAKKGVDASNVAAPVDSGSSSGNSGGGNRGGKVFRLTPEMREMALRTYGPGTSHNLKAGEAEQRYAKKQIEIQERRARGERI